ncbi:polysaccharide biosynthesis protein [Oribacterium sinus F0268]|uniref:UDP-glucose 4-epimerase n=2 Tax=Oribacterium sinus TaxID=237576 RepID=C2KZH6_9FIRM|nr:polysaccharide biosynthesis protein [Oribacterium sinus F0268]
MFIFKEVIMSIFANKTLLITGGTGSFGNAVLRRFIDTDIKEIRIFSRDELKQDDMRHLYNNDKIKYYIGDVRNLSSLEDAMFGVDFVFHAAALKEVPSCEFFPLEAVKTNVIGTDNVLTAAIAKGVKKVICLSTDKAAYPINAMGVSKAMMEKIAVAKSRTVDPQNTSIVCTRYGNVMYSRGSVIPLFISQIKQEKALTLTEPSMTRFIMSLDEAVDLVMFAFENGQSGDILVQKASATTIDVLASAIKNLFHYQKENVVIGLRHGEKMYETLLTNEECASAIDMGNFYRVPSDKRDLNYDNYLSKGTQRNGINEFNSSNTRMLSVAETMDKLMEIPEMQREVEKYCAQKGI